MERVRPQRSNPYYACSVYPSKAHSGNAHILIHFIGYRDKVSLSCYPFTDGKQYFLIVVGDNLDTQTKLRICEALSSGQPVDLPTNVIDKFVERHFSEKRGIG
jgi:hypothetical protein